MTPLRLFSLWTILSIVSVGVVFAQAVGDYGSAGTGNWGTTGGNWLVCQTAGTWAGAIVAPGNPTTATNVWIRNGHIVTLDGSYNCLNLTVETGASLVGDQVLPSGTLRDLRVYGTTTTINGVFGGSSSGTNASLESATSGTKLTLTGSGTFGPARIRVNTAAINDTIVFDINTKFWYTGSAGNGGVGLYPQTDGNVFTINAGRTLTFVNNSGLSASSSNGALATTNLTINVLGSIDLSEANSPLTLKANTGKTVAMNVAVGSSVNVGGNVSASTSADGGTTVMTINGTMTAGGTVDFSKPSFVVTGTGSLTIPAAATLMIGHASGIALSGLSGQIQTTARSFSPAANYSYVGSAPQVTGTGLPATIRGLTINDSSGVTLTNSAIIDTTLTLTSGNIITGGNTLSMTASGTVSRTSGHVVGNLQKAVATGSGVARVFEVGTGTSYAPVSVSFASVSTGGTLTASTTAGDHPNLGTSLINPAKSVNRFWTISNSGVVFTNFDATFNFVSADIDAGASPGVFIAQSYNGSSWSSLTMGTRGSLSTKILGATSFSAFAVGEATGAPLAPAFELSQSSVDFGNVAVGNTKADTVFVRNIGTAVLHISSITSSNSPTYTVSPGSATVNVGDSAQVLLTFAPTVVGSPGSKVPFVHDGASSPDTLTLSGNAVAGVIQSNGTGGGDWLNTSTWQGGVLPTRNDSVLIHGTDSVFVLADTSCQGLYIQTGGRLALYDTLRIRGSATVYGLVEADTNGRFQVDDTSEFENGGTYKHARDGGNFPNGRWKTGSTISITGLVTSAPATGNQSYYNVVWNCPNQTANLNMGWDSVTIGGNITVLSTGGGRWQMTAPLANDSSVVTIMGDVVQSGGNFTTNGTGNGLSRINIHHYGNVLVTGGNFSISRGSQGGTGTTRWYLHNGDFSMSNATTQNSNPTNAWFVFAKPGTQSLTLGAGNTLTALPFEVAGGTTLNAGTSVVRGSGLVTINSGATLQCAQLGGIDSTLAGTGTRTLSPGSNYTFNGSVLQRTGRRLPDTLNTLTISNSSGITLSDSILVNGTVSVTSGNLDLNGKMITLGPSGLLSETAGNTVTGTSGVIRTTRTLTAPSSSTDIAGMGVKIGSSADLGSTVITRGHAVQAGAGSGSIKRYFDLAPTTNTGLNATLVFRYDDSELNALPEANLLFYKSTDGGTTWVSAGGSVNTSGNTITLSGVNDLSRWTASASSTVNVNTGIFSGWNMISNPVTNAVPDDSAKHLFPTIISRVFAFASGYVTGDIMVNGKGYWGKFPAATTNTITGTARTRDSVSVVSGWNMTGSITNTVDTNTIVSVPAGLRASNWFGWSGAGYAVVAQLAPGKAFWVKSLAPGGKFVLANPPVSRPAKTVANGVSPLDALNSLTVSDSKGNSQTLYFGADAKNEIDVPMFAMPPAPPVGALDARFATADGGSMVQTHPERVETAIEFPVTIQSDSYPLSVRWNVNKGTATYALTGAFGSKEMTGEGTLNITSSDITRITVKLVSDGSLPKEFSLSQNYPNPFNPSTTIKYGLPVDSRVTVDVYNVIGQRVRTLVADNQVAGYHVAEWNGLNNDGQQLSSGVYFLQMSARGINGKSFSEIRKLMMMK